MHLTAPTSIEAASSRGAHFDDLRGRSVSNHLDLIRGLSAIAVLVYHVRYRFFLDYSELPGTSWLAKGFYTATSFGHDAVMVFFVLSGFFIAGSIVRDHVRGRWNWKHYLTSRLTRLYVVLLPGILLTLAWDSAGLSLFSSHPIYTGVKQTWTHDYIDVGARLTPRTLLGNLTFVQTILVEPFGSNVPLWSLAYEFWYYIAFPLGIVAILQRRSLLGIAAGLLAAGVVLVGAGRGIAIYFPIWLLGAAIGFIPRSRPMERYRTWIIPAAACLFVGVTVGTHLSVAEQVFGPSSVYRDYAVGGSFALLLYALLHVHRVSSQSTYAWLAGQLAGFSYSLYVLHDPVLTFTRAACNPGKPWAATYTTLCYATAVTAICIVYAYAVYWVTEARTDWVRQMLTTPRLRRPSPGLEEAS